MLTSISSEESQCIVCHQPQTQIPLEYILFIRHPECKCTPIICSRCQPQIQNCPYCRRGTPLPHSQLPVMNTMVSNLFFYEIFPIICFLVGRTVSLIYFFVSLIDNITKLEKIFSCVIITYDLSISVLWVLNLIYKGLVFQSRWSLIFVIINQALDIGAIGLCLSPFVSSQKFLYAIWIQAIIAILYDLNLRVKGHIAFFQN